MTVKNLIPITLNYNTILPMAATRVCAGFPSPADDYLEDPVDLGSLLVPRPAATFMWRVQGASMIDVGINHDDILVVDRSLPPQPGHVVVVVIDGECSVKVLTQLNGRPTLAFANKTMPEFQLSVDAEVTIWGVVTYNIHRHLP